MVNNQIEPIKDAIGHPLAIGDFVTAVFFSGEVSLFEVLGFENRRVRRGWGNGTEFAKLRRRFQKQDLNKEKPVYKTSSQITWVDKQSAIEYLMLSILES